MATARPKPSREDDSETARSARHERANVALALAFLMVCFGCRHEPPPVETPTTAAAGATVVHGNHDPKFGGVVLMNGDLHFEVVLGPDGMYAVYFSDAARVELPAAFASQVTITVSRSDGRHDTIPLQIDDAGEAWVGHGRPVEDPQAVARIAYQAQGQRYWIDLPFSASRSGRVSSSSR
jgi:hypothetical protein